MSEKKILQIVPASTNWRAVYWGEKEDGSLDLYTFPVAVWALTDEGVEGMDGRDYLDFCEDSSNFVGYVGPGQSPDLLREDAEAARELARAIQAKRDAGKA